MTETVMVALITFASGAVGAIAGVLGVIISARISAKAQMKQTVVQERFRIRAEAYQHVFDANLEMSAANYDVESKGKFLKSVQTACVVSSPEVSAILMPLQELIMSGLDIPYAQEKLADALIAMQHDLDNFTEPRIAKNKWSKDWLKKRLKQPKEQA